MTYEDIKSRYNRLTSDELKKEIRLRNAYRYDTSKVGAADCMIEANILRVCKELLRERGEAVS